MSNVENGIVVSSDSTWYRVKPKCPYCGHVGGDWEIASVGIPKIEHSKHSVPATCKNCRKSFRIVAYPG